VKPDVLLMDEPLSNLDALLRLEMRSELKGLLRELGTTTIYVTHDQVEAMSLADRIAVMNGGVIEQYESPERVYTQPATTFVGSFIGNPPMNFLNDAAQWHALGTTALTNAKSLGVRPEDLQIAETGLPCEIRVVEMLGASVQATMKSGASTIRLSVPPNIPLHVGQTVHLRAAANAARWYDTDGKLVA
jgi:multiple sugar transport system ATP-binding protein